MGGSPTLAKEGRGCPCPRVVRLALPAVRRISALPAKPLALGHEAGLPSPPSDGPGSKLAMGGAEVLMKLTNTRRELLALFLLLGTAGCRKELSKAPVVPVKVKVLAS